MPPALVHRVHAAYRRTGADLPWGDPLRAHGVAMEGYFWRITHGDEAIIALIGVNRCREQHWATLGLASRQTLTTTAHPQAQADPARVHAAAGAAFTGDDRRLRVDLGPGARLEAIFEGLVPWPGQRPFGGSSIFQSVPRLNQYWHPWLLGGRASGVAELDDRTVEFTNAQVYAEKNWGAEGFPEAWWWGQAQGFADDAACVAFAGGVVTAGPLRTEVTALVVRLPDGTVLRLGNPLVSPVRARVTDETWDLAGRGGRWRIEVHGAAPLSAAHVLPVPLPSQRRNTAGAIEHLHGDLSITVRRDGRLVWEGQSRVAGLEHGGLERAEAELRRRGIPAGDGAAPAC